MLYRSLIRDQPPEAREKIDQELTDPGRDARKVESHPAVKADPALGLRLRYQERIRNAATELEKDRLTRELAGKLIDLKNEGVGGG